MDAGLAGLVGALGGATLGAAGAWGAALIAFRGARYQADKQSQSAHDQWLRQIRRETYAAFLGFAQTAADRPRGLVAALSARRHAEAQQILDAIEADVANLDRAYGAVLLEAPSAVSEAARHFIGELNNLLLAGRVALAQGSGHESVRGRHSAAYLLLKSLADTCRSSLQDPVS
ncbi:hypothetical protein [Streptomyces sp. NPDC018584]|uniref:hypothetical protein n=1 Tax=unclassified Streptomyces TaxID=2593676 RepID=UPI0037905077